MSVTGAETSVDDPYVKLLAREDVALKGEICRELMQWQKKRKKKERARSTVVAMAGDTATMPERFVNAFADSLECGVEQYVRHLDNRGVRPGWDCFQAPLRFNKPERWVSVSNGQGRLYRSNLDDLTRVLRCVWFACPTPDGAGVVVCGDGRRPVKITASFSGSLLLFPATWTYSFAYDPPSSSAEPASSYLVFEGGLHVSSEGGPQGALA